MIAALKKRLRAAAERVAGTFYEGPEPPSRLADEVRAFRVMYPEATADEWERAMQSMLAQAYQQGWVRGYEAQERAAREEPPWLKPPEPEVHPYAQRVLSLGYDPENPLAGATQEEREQFMRELMSGWTIEDGNPGSHREEEQEDERAEGARE